ncbi:LOW QUALITY PROTEIN: prefoldin subunit 3 [Sorex fumeus]|uniref:LOW QUALITY PROTEIN: prefoldin subunit 3 n=1 Tax=Sorex fumeus TaxID=62283 RepID=UPI0024ACD2E0|nr:LOW QUALITY PROTEIN: prefoldin subunit 3 [Sorex fumeus]
MKNMVPDIKELIVTLKSRITEAEQKIKELQDEKEPTKKQQKVQNCLKRNQQHTRELWDEFKRNNVRIIGVPEELEGKCEETIIKEMIHKNFPELRITVTEIQEARRFPVKIDLIGKTPRNIILKMTKFKTSQSRAPGGGRSGGQSRARSPNMAVAKDGGGFGGGAAGNGRRLHLGIPEAVFVEDVDNFMKQPGNETADVVLKKLDEQYQKYKFMELNLAQKKRRLKNQIPEIKQTLEILKYMQKKKESTNSMETRFLLADNLYCKASVPPTDKVCLWLGANVMLEYDIDEAQALLEKNLSTATKNLDSLEEDLDFLRDQFTTTEVNMARVYNWDVKRRNKDDPTKNKA